MVQCSLPGRMTVVAAVIAGIAAGGSFREHTVATGLRGGYQVVAVDLNRDRRPDLLALASGMTELVWFENPGWERHVIAAGLNRMINVAPHDNDGDGVPELIVAHEFANVARNSVGIVSVLKHTGDPKLPWERRDIDKLTTSHRLRWASFGGDGPKVAVNAPLTGAGAEPPLYGGATPLVFYDPENWRREEIPTANTGVVHGILIYDWNRDGRDDVLTASFGGIHAHSRDRKGRWMRTEIARGDPAPPPKGGSSDIAVGRLGKARFLAAIEPWHGNEVVVYSPRRAVIDTGLNDGHTILTADFDGDGRDEIVAGCRGEPRSVMLYREMKGHWTKELVDSGGIAAASCTSADLNGDGRPDLACIGSATANLKWYENLPAPAHR